MLPFLLFSSASSDSLHLLLSLSYSLPSGQGQGGYGGKLQQRIRKVFRYLINEFACFLIKSLIEIPFLDCAKLFQPILPTQDFCAILYTLLACCAKERPQSVFPQLFSQAATALLYRMSKEKKSLWYTAYAQAFLHNQKQRNLRFIRLPQYENLS